METYSIRESLQGKLVDYVKTSGFEAPGMIHFVRDTVSLLAAYREEDVPLYPELFLFADEASAASITSTRLPYWVGVTPLVEGAAKQVLKNCSPLAVRGWAIFAVAIGDGMLRFGVFRNRRTALSVGADEVIREAPEITALLIRNRGAETVEIQNRHANQFLAVFKATTASGPQLEQHVEIFVGGVCQNIPNQGDFPAYLHRTLVRILQRCHGTMLACSPPQSSAMEKAVKGGILLRPALSLYSMFESAREGKEPNALADLDAVEALIEGLIGSDGLVVFGTDGTVCAYRTIVHANRTEEKAVRDVVGGSRKKAFETLRLRVPSVYSSILFRSQDGDSDAYAGGSNVTKF